MHIFSSSKKRIIIIALLTPIFYACSAPYTLSKKQSRRINNISIAVNFILTNDVEGTVDTVDLPLCKLMANSIIDEVSEQLTQKGYSVSERHISISRARKLKHKQYVIENENEREYAVSELTIRRGMLYSDRLDVRQIAQLYRAVDKRKHLKHPEKMMFKGDAILFITIDGRLTGTDKKVGKGIANAGLAALYILGIMAGGAISGGNMNVNGNPYFLDLDDRYTVHTGVFTNYKGKILMANKFVTEDFNKIVDVSVTHVKYSIASKQ